MRPNIPEVILSTLQSNIDTTIERVERISGGCIHHTYCLHLPDKKLFLKYNRLDQATNFEIEARGLQLLDGTHTLAIPKVHFYGQSVQFAYLVLEWVEQGRQSRDYWSVFGEQLAKLHQHTQAQFGLDHDNYIGALPQQNGPMATWTDFFIERRLQPMLKAAVERGHLERSDEQAFERLYQRLPGMFPEEKPALLHGDLWGGNFLTGLDGYPVLIDPAVYYGHREMELAFMTLFDRQPPIFYDAYQSVAPLAEDWEKRIDLCNLYPLLVHINLFGGGYIGSMRSALRQYV
jgi:protein-ribulosamine 3-kinase